MNNMQIMESDRKPTNNLEQTKTETRPVDEVPKFILKTLSEDERKTHLENRLKTIIGTLKSGFETNEETIKQIEASINLEWAQIIIDINGKKEFLYIPTANNNADSIDGFDKSDLSALAYNFVNYSKTIDTELPTDTDDKSTYILLPSNIPHRAYADATNGITPLTMRTIKYNQSILAHEMTHIKVGGSKGTLSDVVFRSYAEGAARYIERKVNYGQHPELPILSKEGNLALLNALDDAEPSLNAIYKQANQGNNKLEKYREYTYLYGDASVEAMENTQKLPKDFVKEFYNEVFSKKNAEIYLRHARENQHMADLAIMELAMTNILKSKYLYSESAVEDAFSQYKVELKNRLKDKLRS